MLLRACKLQAVPVSRRVAPSLVRRKLTTDSTPNAPAPVNPGSTRDEILQARLVRFRDIYSQILQAENPRVDESFEVLPVSLDEMSESEREETNAALAYFEESGELTQWLARLGQPGSENAVVTDVAVAADTTPATAGEDATARPSDIVPAENAAIMTADTISGAPSQLRHRSVRVYQATRNTMQSGGAKGERWRIDWDILQGGGRWENPLMGWASSADYMQGTRLSFKSQEDAIHFAKKQGWDYYVQSPTVKRIPPKNYSENYLYRANKLRIAKTK